MIEAWAVALVYGPAIILAELVGIFYSRQGIQSLRRGQIVPALLVIMWVATELIIHY